ncbi:MAG TPA: helix-turn-helix domain-containing protein [Puia sp.]|jgi:transposase|nr:helix-turn-helix domain-containing protein [Puia sp.]
MSLEDNKNELPALKKTGGQYDKLAVQKIVEAIEGGMRRRDVCDIYGLSRSTIRDWMKNYGSESYQVSKQGHLNNAQKRSMIRAIREGRMTLKEAKLAYNMKSYTAILNLLRQEKENSDLRGDMKPKANTAPGQEDAEKKALQKALEEAQLKIKALNTLIDVAEDQFKIPIRKKPGAKRSKP